MAHLPNVAKDLVSAGATIDVTGAKYLPGTLTELVTAAVRGGGHVIIDGDAYLPGTLAELAKLGGRHVTIRL